MNKYSTSIGTAILMMMVGMSPIILSVIVTLASQNSDLETYTMPVAYLIGGLLCIFVANKGLNIQFRDYVHKPDIRLLILVIASAIFYEIFMTYTVYRETLAETTVLTTDDIFPIADLVFIAPLSEELIFRFAMLTILLIAPGNSRMKLSFSIGFVSILWVLPHFSGFTMRSMDIAFAGMIIGIIYWFSKNLLYCIVFHATTNFITVITVIFSEFFYQRAYLFYVSLGMWLLWIPTLFIVLYCNRNQYSFQPLETIKSLHSK
ncbi:MAG: CPBP family intramembrane glutamic endopeptidase [Oscillospiraceae bacterium]